MKGEEDRKTRFLAGIFFQIAGEMGDDDQFSDFDCRKLQFWFNVDCLLSFHVTKIINMSSIKEFEHLRIPLQAIKLATNNFDDNNYISRGGFGKVYKGDLVRFGKSVTVAVKCLDRALGQGNPEFWKEIMMLSRYKHQNLVSLLGFCYEEGESIIVYEYLPNKSLNMHLSSIDLSWIQRLKICIGAAKGLQYLHDPGRTMQRVLHRDIKSSNILLDENWNAKISDFGLSNLGPANQEFTFLFTHPVGSFGYCDPAYVESGFLTKESDVYSFGVVLFEVLCGRLCIVDCKDNRLFLPNLLEHMSRECLRKFSTIAYQCLHKDRTQRPTFAKIVRELQIALQCQYQDQSMFPRNDDFAPITPSAHVNKDEQNPKYTLAAYRSAAADVVAHMQAVSRARYFERLKKDVESSNTEEEARSIIASMRIHNRLSLDFHDEFGWTALHWAAHYGRGGGHRWKEHISHLRYQNEGFGSTSWKIGIGPKHVAFSCKGIAASNQRTTTTNTRTHASPVVSDIHGQPTNP
ncbi:hypothetical protein OSB04_014034 [Centaurea solstitialis]|uniref:non-specific serine/threonine protein kinase n=1 Tax=Centaurea solstitialis TaxID=347529 RepID=A0AA38TR13_9ASTR|nr:hypothetical protein OSB04_014034 [Centaurea solstitialis]